MPETYDVVVVGVGAMGASACDHLARRGVSVLGLERYDIPHALGSSGGQTRLIRLAYYEHPDYVPLLRRAYENWDDLHRRSGVQALHRVGCLYLGPPRGHLIAGTRRAAAEHELEVEEWTHRELGKRVGVFEVPESFAVLFEPQGGFVLCEQAISAFADEALHAGAVLRAREAVLDWSSDASGVRLRTQRSEIHAGSAVFTVGAWSPTLLGDLGVKLKVTRQVLGWVWPRTPERFEYPRFPCWGLQHDDPGFEGIYYGFPILPVAEFGGERGLKLAHHAPGEVADPEALDREISVADEEDFRPALRYYLPDADGPTLVARACLYTSTRDEVFVVDRHPEHTQVVVACGFSGHGFKFSSAIGEALADLALEGRSELPIGFLSLERFAN